MNSNNNNSEEICALDSTIAYSLEPFCEMIHIIFVYGEKRLEYEIQVPIDALNNEIYHAGFKIIPFLSADKENPELEVRVELPAAQIPWEQAIRQFEKYLKPPHKNNKRITNSPIIPVNLAPNFWFPLYYLTKRFDMQNFQRKLMNITFTTSYCIAILSQIYEMTNFGFQFPEVDSIIFKTLSSNLDSLPPQSFRGIEMASAILKIIQTDSSNSNNPPSLIEWLINVFPKFAEKPNNPANRSNILKIINFIKRDSPKTAFIYWCYSLFFEQIDSDQILDEYIDHFELKDCYKLLFNVPFESIMWLLTRINLDINRTQVAELIIQLIRSYSSESSYYNNRTYQAQQLFDFAIDHHLLNIDRLDTQALCTLLPYAFKFNNQHSDLVYQFIDRIKSGSYESAVCSKNPNYALLPWNILLSAFSLIHNPIPSNRRSNLHNDMRLEYKKADSIFFSWIYTNRNNTRLVNLNTINQYLSLPSTDVSLARSPHRKLMLYDVLTYLPPSPQVNELKRSLFEKSKRQPFNFVDCLNKLLSKSKLKLAVETLELIHRCIRKSTYKMTLFCSILEKFYIPIPYPQLIENVNEYSVKTCINIMYQSIIGNHKATNEYVNALIHIVKPMATYVFNMLSVQEIYRLARIIPFSDFMFDNFITNVDEDNVLFYAFSTQLFQATIMHKNGNQPINWKYINSQQFQSELDLINWSHVSSRALVKLVSPFLDFLKSVNFQFDEEDEIIPNLPLINNINVAKDVYNKWKEMKPIRTPNKNLAAIPPKSATLYLIGFDISSIIGENNELLKQQFDFIGYGNIEIHFIDEDTIYTSEDDGAVIVYKNIELSAHQVSIKNFIHSLFQSKEVPIVINSLALQQILEECPDEWFAYVGQGKEKNYQFLFTSEEEAQTTSYQFNNYGYNYSYTFEGNAGNAGGFGGYSQGGYAQNNGYNGNGGYGSQSFNYNGGYNGSNGYNGYNGGYNNGQNYDNFNGYGNGGYNGYAGYTGPGLGQTQGSYGCYNGGNGFYGNNNGNNGRYHQSQNHSIQTFNDQTEHIRWKEPTPSLLPMKKDLIQFSMIQNPDYYFKSIPFYPKDNIQFLKSKIEWINGRIIACSLIGRPLSIFNFGLSINLNRMTRDENNLSMFYYFVVLKQTSHCLLSLMSESVAEINPIISSINSPPDQGQPDQEPQD